MRRHMMLALALLAAACGKTRLPGGGDGAETDGGTPDSTAIGPVSVTVLSFDGLRTPREGIDVGFFAADGTHQVTVATGADGMAESDLEAGGAVVVFETPPAAFGGGGSSRAYAVLAVEPDDHIVVGGEPFPFSPDAPISMTVTLPLVTGATFYEVDTSCGNFSNSDRVVTLNFLPVCDLDTFSFLAVTTGDAGRQYLREQDVPVVASGNYDAMASWQMTPTRPFLFTGVPTEAGNIATGVYALRIGEDQMNANLLRDQAQIAEDMITLRPERIPNYDATLIWSELRPEQPALGAFDLVRWLGPDDDTDADLADLMLPWMSPVSYDSAARAIQWRVIGDQPYDATYLTMIASINDETFLETTWFVMAPPGIEEIVFPDIPAAKSGWFLPDPEFVNVYGQIVESNQIDGYGAARQVGFDPSYFPYHEPLGAVVRTTFSGTILR